jgi:hypothetical protein
MLPLASIVIYKVIIIIKVESVFIVGGVDVIKTYE